MNFNQTDMALLQIMIVVLLMVILLVLIALPTLIHRQKKK